MPGRRAVHGRDDNPSPGKRLGWLAQAAAFAAYSGLMRALPLETASNFGAWLVARIGPMTGTEKTVQRNLRLAFPDMDPADRAALSRAQWASTGRTFAEFPLMDRITPATGRVEVVGGERLQAIRDSGRAAVLVSGHFSNWEAMAAAIVATGLKTQITYRAGNNPYVDRMIIRGRARYGVELMAAKGGDGARELLDGMKRGESVALLNDQKFREGPQVAFFGHPVNTATGPSRLAQRFDAPIIPVTVERSGPARLKVTFHPEMRVRPAASPADRARAVEEATQAITRFIEDQVRARPEEWFWTHKRWPDEVYATLEAAPSSVERRQGPA
ncbi:MAG: lysophospholipid acyltransferase family protein [Brevundimonas sp.]